MKSIVAVLFVAVWLGACAAKHVPTEYDVVLKRAKPASEDARAQECSWIATSLDRQKKLASYVAATSTYPEIALAHQDAAQRNMVVLQSRAQAIQCQAGGGAFDECFARCRSNTDRSRDQCFDACHSYFFFFGGGAYTLVAARRASSVSSCSL